MIDQAEARSCGACTACCKPLTIPEIGKYDFNWCRHLTADKGCGIYDARPHVCRAFKCAWLHGIGDEELRPDRVGFFIMESPDLKVGERGFHLFRFYEVREGGLSTDYAREAIQLNVDAGHIVSTHSINGPAHYSVKAIISRKYALETAQLIERVFHAEAGRRIAFVRA